MARVRMRNWSACEEEDMGEDFIREGQKACRAGLLLGYAEPGLVDNVAQQRLRVQSCKIGNCMLAGSPWLVPTSNFCN